MQQISIFTNIIRKQTRKFVTIQNSNSSKFENIYKLRKETQASLKLCREALDNTNFNYNEALKYLNLLLLSKGNNHIANLDSKFKSSLLFAQKNTNSIDILELACESDFVCGNRNFLDLGKELLSSGNEVFSSLACNPNFPFFQPSSDVCNSIFGDSLAKTSGILGESIKIADFNRILSTNFIALYMHQNIPLNTPSTIYCGSKLAIASLKIKNMDQNIDDFGRKISQHILANNSISNLESEFLNQKFLFDESKTLKDYIKESPFEDLEYCLIKNKQEKMKLLSKNDQNYIFNKL